MKAFKLIVTVLFSLLISGGFAAFGSMHGFNPFLIGALVFASSFVPKPAGVFEGINVEIWRNFIVENLFRNNRFIEKSVDASDNVLNGSVVHIPNAGNPSNVERNRQNLPAKIQRRQDTDVTYVLDEFTTDPITIQDAEQAELSYNKLESVMSNDMASLRQLIAEWMLYNWRFEGADQKIMTTGTSVTSYLSGTTGNRKKLTIENFEEGQAVMDEQNVPEENRFAMLDARMYQQLINQLSPGDYKDFSRYLDVEKGIVGELFGFQIMKRSKALRTNSSNVVKEPDASAASGDKAAALLWQQTMVEKALGSIEAFEDLKNPTMYGDIYSFMARAGGRKRRGDNKGVLGIIQDSV